MKKFELFMGSLGNGLTICNKAVREHGDYKKFAHIAECGKITWYVNPSTYVPGDALLRIEHSADAMRADWEKRLADMGELKAYEFLLDSAPHTAFMHVVQEMKNCELWQKINYLKSVYLQKSTW